MRNYIAYYNLRPGDEIVVPKSGLNIVQHYALYIGYGEHGTDWIIHNDFKIGVSLVTAVDFFSNCPQVNKINRFIGTNYERRKLVERALKNIGKPYNMINYNCEHFLTEIKTEVAISRQVETALVGLGLFVFIGILLGE